MATPERKPDVAIVGASAAGTFAGLLLARQGHRVRIFERSEELAHQPRTLIVTSRFRDYLGTLGDSSILNEIHTFELFGGGRSTTTHLVKPDLIIERSTLIRGLAKEAVNEGAEIVYGHRFVGLEPKGDSIELSFEKGTGRQATKAEASIVIGADGSNSRVASASGLRTQPTSPLLQAIVRLPRDVPASVSRVWFRPQDTKYFYWLVPESPEIGALGIIGEDQKAIRYRLDGFLSELGLTALEYRAAMIPIYKKWLPVSASVGNATVYLVGDAAGHVKVSTVGGIVTGFRGVLGVVESVLTNRAGHEIKSLKRELDAHAWVRWVLNRFSDDRYASLLDLTGHSLSGALSLYTRDEALKILWNCLRNEPRVASLVLRSVLSGVKS